MVDKIRCSIRITGDKWCDKNAGHEGDHAAAPLVYVGSSWKNADYLTLVHAELRSIGVRTWDFRENGFWWKDVEETDPYRFLDSEEAVKAYNFDKEGLDKADAGLFILPAGTATALEAGYMAGLGKPTVVWGAPREPRLDIMWKLTSAQLRMQDYSLQEVAKSMLLIARDRGGCMP
jgi:hypothetical protein